MGNFRSFFRGSVFFLHFLILIDPNSNFLDLKKDDFIEKAGATRNRVVYICFQCYNLAKTEVQKKLIMKYFILFQKLGTEFSVLRNQRRHFCEEVIDDEGPRDQKKAEMIATNVSMDNFIKEFFDTYSYMNELTFNNFDKI